MAVYNIIEQDISNLGVVLGNLLSALFGFIGFITGINMVLAGIKLVSSQGDPKALMAAKAKFTWAVLGFFIALSVFTIIRLVGILVGKSDLLPGTINLDTNLLK
ncbi:hypothetical protein KJ678_02295 [Patescibacteria group bacterium]|nr:hypothetical protein [Patescibacteria group bacterium]